RQARIGGSPDALDIELPGEGFVPYYRYQQDTFIHRDPFDCDDGARLTAASRNDRVETPAGVFDGCLRLDFGEREGGSCDDAGKISEWWKPEVGLVRWTEYWIGGVRSYVLESFERLGPRAPFLRGDSDGSLSLELTDAVHTLNHLFLGGPRPPCEDGADSNDDGALNISDAVFTLGYLFLGSAPPPFPGPEVAGFDGTPGDPFPCGDSPLPEPELVSSSSLPGVSFDLSGNPPVLTLAQAARGVTFVYRTRIERDLSGLTSPPLDAGGCDAPDPSGLTVLELISGYGHNYCLCDTGFCPPGDYRVDLVAGVYEGRFEWDGREWLGPSDTGNPKGDPFPPGTYEVRVTAAGEHRDATGSEVHWEAAGTVGIHVVP
ncbi:MAG: hypothetical protein HY721_11390, partial [Planctomycetes bacterium]|nr:hypothetical protein [Planctomycetota bacterium]